MDIDVIPLEGFDEGLGHAVGFGASDGSKTVDEAHILCKSSCLAGGVTAAIVAEPLHPVWEQVNGAEAPLNGFSHQIAHHFPSNAASGGNMADDFTITAIQGEGNTHYLPIPAGNLK